MLDVAGSVRRYDSSFSVAFTASRSVLGHHCLTAKESLGPCSLVKYLFSAITLWASFYKSGNTLPSAHRQNLTNYPCPFYQTSLSRPCITQICTGIQNVHVGLP